MKLNIKKSVGITAVFLFSFYYLNSPILLWISSSGDLWVTALSLLFAIKTFDFIDNPGPISFLYLLFLGLSAVLFKESGFVTIGLFFTIVILYSKNSFRLKLIPYSIIMILLYSLYLFFYFKTQTFVDQDIEVNMKVFVNIWYYLGYIAVPISQRAAVMFPESYLWVLKSIKVIVSIVVPIFFILLIKSRNKSLLFFGAWSIMFLSTVSVFKMDLNLFDIFPGRPISRYMYSAVPGVLLIVAYFLNNLYNSRFKFWGIRKTLLAFTIFYIAGNFTAIGILSDLFREKQRMSDHIVASLDLLSNSLLENDTLIVVVDNIDNSEQMIKSEIHLESLILVKFDKNVEVEVVERGNAPVFAENASNHKHVVRWLPESYKLVSTDLER